MKRNQFKPTIIKVLRSKWLCLVLLSISLTLSLIAIGFLGKSIANRTLSSFGREHRAWFILWGVFTSLSVLSNMLMFQRDFNLHKRLLGIITVFGSMSVIITSLVVGEDTLQKVIHYTSVITFGLLCFLGIAYSYFITRKQKKSLNIILIVMTASAVADIVYFSICGLTALCELLLLFVCQFCIFFSNFIIKSPNHKH